ncbi:MAG: FKBP-type peptidyl-prolyl cis-trans isomerase [Acidobacteria bacterium]|nr:MAG: FKBP-type peptidyl-prolyl cis-trans isomerase [Acidobacteriota bacterium]
MKSRMIAIAALGALLGLPALAEKPALESEDQKTIYALGLALSKQLTEFGLQADELDALYAGLGDGILGKEPKVSFEEYLPKLRELRTQRMQMVAARNKSEGKAFVDKACQESGAVRSESGLAYLELEPGSGPSPKATDKVRVHYTGRLVDGTVFDSSRQRGTPAEFNLSQVIPCWTEALQKMKVGGKARLYCPSDIAYGDTGRPPAIPPGATLVFDVELLDVVQPSQPKP